MTSPKQNILREQFSRILNSCSYTKAEGGDGFDHDLALSELMRAVSDMDAPSTPLPVGQEAHEKAAKQANLRHIEECLICHGNFGRGAEMTAVVAEKILAGLTVPALPAAQDGQRGEAQDNADFRLAVEELLAKSAGDSDDDAVTVLVRILNDYDRLRKSAQQQAQADAAKLRGALHNACDTIREARLSLEGKTHLPKSEAISLLGGAEIDYRAVLRSSHVPAKLDMETARLHAHEILELLYGPLDDKSDAVVLSDLEDLAGYLCNKGLFKSGRLITSELSRVSPPRPARTEEELKQAKNAGREEIMAIWLRCLGGKVYPKAHHIDELGKTTRQLTTDRDAVLARLTSAQEAIRVIAYWPQDDNPFATLENMRQYARAALAARPPTKGTTDTERLAGFDLAVAKVEYWLEGHKTRLITFPANSHIECEIKDITELLGALVSDRAALHSSGKDAEQGKAP